MVAVFGVGTQLLYAFIFFFFLNSVISLPRFTTFIVYQYFLFFFFHFFAISLSVQPQSFPFPGSLSCLSTPLASFPPKAFRPQFCSGLSSCYQSPCLWIQNPSSHTTAKQTRATSPVLLIHILYAFSQGQMEQQEPSASWTWCIRKLPDPL